MGDAVVFDPMCTRWLPRLEPTESCRRDVRGECLSQFLACAAKRYGVGEQDVVPTMGASLAIHHIMFALVRPGDHVIVERPTYEPLHRVPEALGADVSRLERRIDEGWTVVPERLAKLLTPRTRAVVLSHLHNPSGIPCSREVLQAIADSASHVGATVLVDEVYLDFLFDASPDATNPPACLLAPNLVSWSSATKCFGFSAPRIGWIVTTDAETNKLLRIAMDYLQVHMPVSTLRIGVAVLEHASELTRTAVRVSEAGQRVVERWMEAETRVQWVAPPGGLTGVLRLPEFMQDIAFAEHLRARYDTQVVPGRFFEAPGHVRISWSMPEKALEQALANISAALDDLVG